MAHFIRSMSLLIPALAPGIVLADQSPVVFPHPLITEVLYAVPSGPRGDANADGERDAIGDEFVELVNPHDKPIQLKGYTLVDADAWSPGAPKPEGAGKPDATGKPSSPGDSSKPKPADAPKRSSEPSTTAEVRFVFPDLELKPGEVVVVFNGYHQKIPGAVGTSAKAPTGANEHFHNAYVFTMENQSPYAAFNNEADFVVLLGPGDKPVQVIKWGKTAKTPPKDAALTEEAPASMGSVQRDGVSGKLVAHKELRGELSGTMFSPGVFSLKPTEGSAPVKPAGPKPSSKPTTPASPATAPSGPGRGG